MNAAKEIKLEKSGLERICDVLSVAGLAGFVILMLTQWQQLPATIPIHFNLAGEADGWGSKSTLLILPGVALFIYILMSVLGGSSKNINYPVRITPENAERQYRLARHLLAVMKTAVILGLLGLTWLIVQAVSSASTHLGSWPVFLFVGGIFAVVIGYMFIAFKNKT